MAECIHDEPKVFASGVVANNHVDGGFEEVSEPLRFEIATHLEHFLGPLAVGAHFIAPVPSGANGWAYAWQEYSTESGLAVVEVAKVERRRFEATQETNDALALLQAEHGDLGCVVLDDVTSDGGTSEALADFYEERGIKVRLVASLLFRGIAPTIASKYSRATLMKQYVPTQLDWNTYRRSGEISELTS